MTQIIFNPHLEERKKKRNPAQGISLSSYGGGLDGQHGVNASGSPHASPPLRGKASPPVLYTPGQGPQIVPADVLARMLAASGVVAGSSGGGPSF